MLHFGTYLKQLIEQNEINLYALAKQAGIERTTMHKIMANNRVPAPEYVQKLMAALPISPSEKAQLLEAYRIAKAGPEKYLQRLQVKDIIEAVADIKDVPYQAYTGSMGAKNTAAIGAVAVNNMVKNVLLQAAATPSPTIDFAVHGNYGYLYTQLQELLAGHQNAQVRHLLAFSKKVNFSQSGNTNLQLLGHMLPLAFTSPNYKPYYFYNNGAEGDSTNIMPYYIITPDALVLINKDFTRATLVEVAETIAIYKEAFENMLAEGREFLKSFISPFQALEECMGVNSLGENVQQYWIEPQPCIGNYMTPALCDAIARPEIPNREVMVSMLANHYKMLQRAAGNITNLCTVEGAEALANTGQVHYLPPHMCAPVPKETIASMYRKMARDIAKGKLTLHFANPGKIKLSQHTLISISKAGGVFFIMCKVDSFSCFYLEESTITEAFVDFVENLGELECFYTAEESRGIFTQLAKIPAL